MGRGSRTGQARAITAAQLRSNLRGSEPRKISAARMWARQQSVEEYTPEWQQMVWEQTRMGGRSYRTNATRVEALQKRVELLNRKAARFGVKPIELRVTDEHSQQVIPAPDGDRVADWTYVIMGGGGPVVPGFTFVAALDHNNEGGEEAMVAIRRVPPTAVMQDLTEEEAQSLGQVDLEAFRHAGNLCEHCGLRRRRNTTYLVFDKKAGRVVQVGSDCLRDFTGSDNPEAVARWAEMMTALDSDLRVEEHADATADTRRAITTLDYLTAAAASAREIGWRSRWYEGERQQGSTADYAMATVEQSNGATVIEADRQMGQAALDWVREELAERENLSEFEMNMVAYAAGDYLGPKGDGVLAYIPEAYRRERGKKLKAEQLKKSVFVGEVKKRMKGMKLTVQRVKAFENQYGWTYYTDLADEDGNVYSWKASNELEVGQSYSLDGTVKEHVVDSYTGANTTVLTNCRGIEKLAATGS